MGGTVEEGGVGRPELLGRGGAPERYNSKTQRVDSVPPPPTRDHDHGQQGGYQLPDSDVLAGVAFWRWLP